MSSDPPRETDPTHGESGISTPPIPEVDDADTSAPTSGLDAADPNGSMADAGDEERPVWAMGEVSGAEIDPEVVLAQLDLDAPRQRREVGSSKEKLSLYLIVALLLGIGALWFHNESRRIRSQVLGQPSQSTMTVSGEDQEMVQEEAETPDASYVAPMPDNPGDVYRHKARGAMARQDWELAVHMAEQGVKATKRRDAGLLVLLADALVAHHRLDDAVAAYLEADRLSRDETSGHRTAANLLVAAKRCADAVPVLDGARARGDREPSLALALGRCLARLGRSERAVTELEAGGVRSGRDPESLVLLAVQLESLDRPGEALAVYERARSLAPTHGEAGLAIARLRAEGGDLEGVQGWRDSGAPGASGTDAGVLEAHAAFQSGRFKVAAQLYGALVEGVVPGPSSAAILRNHAIALDRAGKTRAALRAYDRALTAAPDDVELHLAFGHLLRVDGRTRRSIKHLTRGLSLAPTSVQGRFELGLAHMDAGEHERAGRQFRAIVDGDPDHLEALQNLGATQVGEGSFAAALITYSALADKRPEDGAVQLTIGSLLTRMGRREEAQRALKLACERGIVEACR